MSVKKAIIIPILFAVTALLSAGCFSITADELYSLPEISEEYIRLQAQINMVLSRGAEFAAPTRGPNRQAVQLMDLNNNGDSEVIAFFTFPVESKLMIYIFTKIDDDYIAVEIIESPGTEIESVRYVDMDGDGTMELVIGWQMGSTLKYMSIYSINEFHGQLLVSAEEYTEIVSLNTSGDGGEDVVVIRLPTQEINAASAKVFSLMRDGEVVADEVRLSAGIESISRVLTGQLADNTPTLFIESEGRFENGSLVTDILAVSRGSFSNISLKAITGVSDDTVRNRMNSSEVNGDGILKIPVLSRLIAQSETEYYAIDWYAYRSNGSRSLALTTYHNNFDEWYLVLPGDWREKVSVRREDTVPGERTIIFSYFENVDDWEHEDFLKIFKLSGDGAAERATRDNRVMLIEQGRVYYAFEFLAPPDSFGLTFNEDMIRENFKLMQTEWQTG